MFHNDYDVLTAYEAMDYLGVGENTIYKLLNSGELGAFRIGKTWKIPQKEIDKYIDKSVKRNTAANTKKQDKLMTSAAEVISNFVREDFCCVI